MAPRAGTIDVLEATETSQSHGYAVIGNLKVHRGSVDRVEPPAREFGPRGYLLLKKFATEA